MPKRNSGIMYIAPSPVHRSTNSDRSNGGSPTDDTFRRERKQELHNKSDVPPKKSVPWSLLAMLPLFTILPYLCKNLHYDLPTPVMNGSPEGLPPVISEGNIRQHIQALENIGFRIIGTDEAVLGEEYVYNIMDDLNEKCKASKVLECTLWLQEGDGMHQFDIMDHAVLKSYRGIRNVIFRISGINTTTTLEGEAIKNAVLLNSHIDSALPSKGSADDAIGVGVMAEVARILIERDTPIAGSAIFLYNGAEETLQDASHLYSTQHETRHDVKALINLEAAGTTGAALLFQASAQEMVDAYSNVPRPHGNVIALEVFQSGIIMSDTDFVQFEKYLCIPGLDFSIVGHSYYYHTRRDVLENIEVGSSQHFGDTVLAVLDSLLAPGSSLNTDTPWTPSNSVYFSLYDRVWFHYSMKTANIFCVFLATIFSVLFLTRTRPDRRGIYYRAMSGPIMDFLAALLASLIVAILLRYVLDKGQTWFTHEQLPLVTFGLPSITAILARHYLMDQGESSNGDVKEHAAAFASVFHSLSIALILQAVGIKSAYLFSNVAFAGLVVMSINEIVAKMANKSGYVSFVPVYLLWNAMSIIFGVEAVTSFLDIFVPLVGRMGRDAPGEIIVSIITAFITHQFTPTLAPFFHRFARKQQQKILLTLLLITGLTTAMFASPMWSSYDAQHPKRTGIQYMYNVTSGQTTLHVAQLDSGPGYAEFVTKIHEKYGLETLPPVKGGPEQWDILYPISAFIESENFPIVSRMSAEHLELPLVEIKLLADRYDDVSGYRTMTLHVTHSGVVTPVLSFSAEVIAWSFRVAPPPRYMRHYVKASASPGNEDFQIVMTVKPESDEGDHKLAVTYMGIDKRQMFPGTARFRPDLPANMMFSEMDAWIAKEWKDSMEVLMYGGICGVVLL